MGLFGASSSECLGEEDSAVRLPAPTPGHRSEEDEGERDCDEARERNEEPEHPIRRARKSQHHYGASNPAPKASP